MTGANFQLSLRGKQDLFLTGNPEYNFIKQVYKRHVNFAIEQYSLTFKNQVDFDKSFDLDIPLNGHLLHKLYFTFKLPPLVKTSGTYAGWTNAVGHTLLDYVEFNISGQIIDKLTGLYLEVNNELTKQHVVSSSEDALVGRTQHPLLLRTNADNETVYFVELPFYFTQNIGSSLPLVKMSYSPIKLSFKLKGFDDCIMYDGITPPDPVSISSANVIAEYIYLDTSEKMKIIRNDQKYLINQIQYTNTQSNSSGGSCRVPLPFNHPCSEMIFVLRDINSELNNDWFNYAKRNIIANTPIVSLIKGAKLLIDNIERIKYTDESILRLLNSNRYHTNTTNKHVYTIPFCNEPEKFYPSGSLNFSMMSEAELYLLLNDSNPIVNIYVFAKNFNFIYFEKGMVKLGYSN